MNFQMLPRLCECALPPFHIQSGKTFGGVRAAPVGQVLCRRSAERFTHSGQEHNPSLLISHSIFCARRVLELARMQERGQLPNLRRMFYETFTFWLLTTIILSASVTHPSEGNLRGAMTASKCAHCNEGSFATRITHMSHMPNCLFIVVIQNLVPSLSSSAVEQKLAS